MLPRADVVPLPRAPAIPSFVEEGVVNDAV